MEYKDFTEKVFDLAKKEGFSDCETYFVESESLSVSVYESNIEQYSVNAARGMSFRGIFGDKMGYSYSEAIDEDAVGMLVKKAKDNAKVIENEDQEFIYGETDNYSYVDTFSPELDKVSADEKIKFAFELEKNMLNAGPLMVRTQTIKLSTSKSMVKIANSKGLSLENISNRALCVAIPVVKDGDGLNNGVAYKVTRDFKELDPVHLAQKAYKDATGYIGAKPVPTGNYKVVFRSETMADLLETFCGIFSAYNSQKGLSLLNKNRVGEQIGSSLLTVVDDPLKSDGFASCHFDDEGVAAKYKEVITGGVFNTLLYNLKTAYKDGVKTTGNASKDSYAAPVDISPTNFYIKPGDITFDNLLKQMGTGLYITELEGLHAGAQMISGDFSLTAKGFMVENGVISYPVNQITVAGNFYTLMKDITAIGDNLEFSLYIGSPSVLVNKLSIAGL